MGSQLSAYEAQKVEHTPCSFLPMRPAARWRYSHEDRSGVFVEVLLERMGCRELFRRFSLLSSSRRSALLLTFACAHLTRSRLLALSEGERSQVVVPLGSSVAVDDDPRVSSEG